MRQALLTVIVGLFVSQALLAQDVAPQASGAANARAVATEVLDRLDAAWNAGDGDAFAKEFSDDADVINIFGAYFHGRTAIAVRMKQIFGTIFKGSVHRSRTLESVRHLSADIIVAVSSAVVDVPSGPLAPQTRNRQTFILVKQQDAWRIVHWHNTPIQPPKSGRTGNTCQGGQRLRSMPAVGPVLSARKCVNR